jgi:hypothetical protein
MMIGDNNGTRTLARGLSSSEPKSIVSAALECHRQAQENGGSGPNGRTIVEIVRCSTSLLDADNLGGSVKYLLDAIRYCGLIRDDDPGSIELKVSQIKVAHRKEVGVSVRVISP